LTLMPRILVLSATTGYQLRAFAESAARLGVDLVYATDRCSTLEDPWLDAAIPIRFHDEDSSLAEIVKASRTRRIDGLIAVGDRPTVLAARAAAALGLRGNPVEAARASANKILARQRFGSEGLKVPWFFVVPTATNVKDVLHDPRLRFPCVVKPIGLSGSRGVIRADSPGDFARAFERVRALLNRVDIRSLRAGLEDRVLVEGFIEGQEYAIEGVLTGGALKIFAIFDKPDPLDGPFFEETVYVTPSSLSGTLQRSVAAHVALGCRALGLRHGPIHAECRIGPEGPVLLEIAARPIGGLCSRVLRFEPGVSLEEILLRHASGEDVSSWRREEAASAVMMVPIPKRGVLKRVEGIDRALQTPRVEEILITAKPDQVIEPLPEAGSYLGFIFARAEDPTAAEAAVREAHRRLTLVIDPLIDVAMA
jgi:biotin carboxylase